MALASTSMFASFDVTDGSQDRDISPVLAKALILDFEFLGRGINVDFANPIHDTVHYWNEDALNSDTVTVSSSLASTGTSLVLTTGHGARVNVGDLLYDEASASTEIMQVTAVSTDTLTITRTYNSTVAASIAASATLDIIRAEQEGSDIGSDKSVAPVVRSNPTQILRGNDLLITGSQLARRMAANELQDYLAHQLANRAIELKRTLSRAALYSEKSSSNAGSDSVYRSFGGMRGWIRDNSGIVDSASAAQSYSNLNTQNKKVVDKGLYVDTLLMGTDTVVSVAGIDSSNRRLRESDTQAGYTVQEILLQHGNMVEVVIDGRVKPIDYFMYQKANVSLLPLQGRGMFVIAATDFADARKRRILAEWTLEFRHPEAAIYGTAKS